MRLTRIAAALALSLHLSANAEVLAALPTVKDPLSYSLKQYGFVLGTALLGGMVSWYAKVRDGKVQPWNISQLIGELTTSAFAGLMAFWVCELLNAPPLLTPALVGIAGHMGTRAISAFEDAARRRFDAAANVPYTPPAPPSPLAAPVATTTTTTTTTAPP